MNAKLKTRKNRSSWRLGGADAYPPYGETSSEETSDGEVRQK